MEVVTFHRTIAVAESSQPSAARFLTREIAHAAGLGEEDSYRAGLVTTELGTNLVKHARDGEILVRPVSESPRGELEVIAIDRGPGMSDVARSMADGHSTSGSSGTGLGAIRRLADDFDIYSEPGRGSAVYVRVRANRAPSANGHPMRVGAVSVPKAGEDVCGDGWTIRHALNGVSALLVDGLGHGLHAAEAANAARAAFARQQFADTSNALQAVHDGLRHTRGAAGAILDVDRDKGTARFSGIGNVSCAIVQQGLMRQTVSNSGTLGHQARHFREYTYPWSDDALFIMYSDGLTSHWSLDEYSGLGMRHPGLIAAVLYRDFSRRRDDVTVLVGRRA
jgi:anti-sigma regulatory factor (Ser/Thr protein kinase)